MALCNVTDIHACSILSGASCAFGVFDGVHKGHRFLLEQAYATAQADHAASVALTFTIDPDELFRPEQLKKLQTNESRLSALVASGVDEVVVLPFTRTLADMSADDFLSTVFGRCIPAHLHVGRDVRFGRAGAGTIDDLRAFGKQVGMRVHAHELVCAEGQAITSTRIRRLLAVGKLAEAQELLGHPYAIESTVQHGRGQGSIMGFPTANLTIDAMHLALCDGVYAGYAWVDGVCSRAALSVGISPVFKHESTSNIEVHLLDIDDELYGKAMRVEFLAYLRPMIAFANTDELIATVTSNIAWVRDNIAMPKKASEHGVL